MIVLWPLSTKRHVVMTFRLDQVSFSVPLQAGRVPSLTSCCTSAILFAVVSPVSFPQRCALSRCRAPINHVFFWTMRDVVIASTQFLFFCFCLLSYWYVSLLFNIFSYSDFSGKQTNFAFSISGFSFPILSTDCVSFFFDVCQCHRDK